MNLKRLTNIELHKSTTETAKAERQVTLELLKHLNEVNRRKMFAQYEASSLHAYCTKHLKLSDRQAAIRVRSAKLLREFPEIESRIEEGALNLTSVCLASSFFQQESKAARFLEREQKAAILTEIENLSTRAVEKLLMSKTLKPEVHLRESLRQKSAELSQLTTSLDNDARADLERLREIWSHANSDGRLALVIKRALGEAVEKHDPLEKAKRAAARAERMKANQATPLGAVSENQDARTSNIIIDAQTTQKREDCSISVDDEFVRAVNVDPISASLKHAVMLRDHGRCTHVNPGTFERCDSRWQLEFDHEMPRALGGENTLENIRLRCRTHNQFLAAEIFGRKTTRFWQHR